MIILKPAIDPIKSNSNKEAALACGLGNLILAAVAF